MCSVSTKTETKPCPICSAGMLIADWEEGTSGLDYPVWECFDCGFEWNTTEAYWSRVYGYLLGIVREKLHDFDSRLAKIPTPS